MSAKSDNSNHAGKLELRRYFLRRYPPVKVLDCCQGEMVLWSRLRQEFPCTYMGLDVKEKRGRLKLKSHRLLENRHLDFDVIDVDTYGSPWKHWFALLPNLSRPTTVFLTAGFSAAGGGVISKEQLRALGIDGLKHFSETRTAFSLVLNPFSLHYCIAQVTHYGLRIIEAREALHGGRFGHTRYIGLRLERA